APGPRLPEAAVARPLRHRRRALEVDRHAVAGDVETDVHRDRAVAEAVVVEEALGGIRAVWERRDRRALELLGLAVDLVARCDVRVVAEAVEDRLEARLARAAR